MLGQKYAPLICSLALAALSAIDSVQENEALWWSFIGAAAALAIWNAALWVAARRTKRTLSFTVALRKQHYLQACAQGSVLLYWGLYWRPVFDSVHLIAAQILFAYGVDMLLVWSRRDSYTLGFGPFPVIFSINLFLWFKPDWFYFQFLMVALGFAAKELITWERDGRRAHIFNPSSFPLAVFSLALMLTGTSNLTWGQEIASTQFYPPHMYLMLFLVGLPGQFFFGVTSMTMSAVVTQRVATDAELPERVRVTAQTGIGIDQLAVRALVGRLECGEPLQRLDLALGPVEGARDARATLERVLLIAPQLTTAFVQPLGKTRRARVETVQQHTAGYGREVGQRIGGSVLDERPEASDIARHE